MLFRSLGRGPHSAASLDATVIGLVDRVTRRMRRAGRVGRTVTLRLRFDDFSRATRSHTLPRATSQTATVIDSVRALLMDALPMIRKRGVTLVGIAMANLDGDDAVQLALPFDELHAPALDAVIDGVRDRFGNDAVGRAVLLGRRMGSVPMLPD